MPSRLLSLPSCLLVLVASAGLTEAKPEWPYNLPRHEKYWPEQEAIVKRDAAIKARMAVEVPHVVRKMSDDPSQKFYFDYWEFAGAGAIADAASQVTLGDDEYFNATLLQPVLKHSDYQSRHWNLPRFFPYGEHGAVQRRDFQCPTGTSACTSIDRADSCCGTGETCVIVQDTGNGDVGCCPDGSSCAGNVANCDTSAGYSSCPDSSNGGCCIPGYTCSGGTTKTSTVSNTATGQASRKTSSITTATSQTSSPAPTSKFTSTNAQGELTCSAGFQTCPASLGGGCCPTDRACGSADCPATSTNAASSTASAVAPFRPTSGSDESSGSLSATTGRSSESLNGCPTGFYVCSAFYQGGCCRVGRDCHSTSCPASASITVVDGNSVTIAGESGVSFASTTGNCANGWSSCPANQGGGCCPSGYGCGSSCTYTGPGTASASAVAKEAPSAAANAAVWGWIWIVAGLASGVAMIVL
ncbi:hypothetical protein HDK77DRAFT_383532 [Phyllosticta capitalensis]